MQNSIIQIGNFSYYSGKAVGQGATGLVYLGFRNSDKLPLAVKAINLKDINTPVKKNLLDCQVLALKTVKNKYVCQAYDVLKDSQYYYVPMQYCPNGTLRNYIKSKGRLSQSQAIQLFSKIVQGYCAIKNAGLIHRDLKTQNVLLRSNMQPAIIDFGYCEKVETQGKYLTYNVGSPAYMSPQAYNDSFYSQKSDIWALGVVLHEMLTGTIPLMRTTDVDQYFRYLKNMKTAQIVQAQQSQLCNKILRSALTVSQQFRPTAQQLKNLINTTFNANSPTKNRNQLSYKQQQMSPLDKINSLNRINSQLQFNRDGIIKTPQKVLNQSQKIYNGAQQNQQHQSPQKLQTSPQVQQQQYQQQQRQLPPQQYQQQQYQQQKQLQLQPPPQLQQMNFITMQKNELTSSVNFQDYSNQSPTRLKLNSNNNNLSGSLNISNLNIQNNNNDNNKFLLRQTLPAKADPNFANLRKKIQSNDLTLNLIPFRKQSYIENVQKPYVSSQKNIPNNSPLVTFIQGPRNQTSNIQPRSLKKVYSTSNVNGLTAHHF